MATRDQTKNCYWMATWDQTKNCYWMVTIALKIDKLEWGFWEYLQTLRETGEKTFTVGISTQHTKENKIWTRQQCGTSFPTMDQHEINLVQRYIQGYKLYIQHVLVYIRRNLKGTILWSTEYQYTTYLQNRKLDASFARWYTSCIYYYKGFNCMTSEIERFTYLTNTTSQATLFVNKLY